MSHIIANEMGAEIRVTPDLLMKGRRFGGDFDQSKLKFHTFIDEIHRLNHTVEEILYPAMEDYALDMVLGKGPSARTIRLTLPRFTLIGATTRAGMLSFH